MVGASAPNPACRRVSFANGYAVSLQRIAAGELSSRVASIGPSLVRTSGGGLALSREKLIEAILQPSKTIDPGYLPLMILTVDGRVASSIHYKHDKGIRRIIDSKGEILSFKDSEIEEMVPQTTSIMPKGLVDTMTIQEFRDLIAYLEMAE